MDPNGFILQDSKEQINNHHKESCLSFFHFALCQRFYDCKIVGEPIWFQFVKEIKKPFRLTAPNNSLGPVKP